MLVLGLMSGTSMDGIDAALTEAGASDDGLHCTLRSFTSHPYSAPVQAALFSLLERSGNTANPATLRDLCALNFAVGEEFARAARATLQPLSEKPELIASHGQTIYHLVLPDGAPSFVPSTLQIGEPAVIAERTGITCVADFRVADVAAGGQGAPLVCFADYQLFRHLPESVVLVNIGGIANVTIIAAGAQADEIRAFDTGPGNMLIDRAVRTLFGGSQRYDQDGTIAKQGAIQRALLRWLLAHTYFSRTAPKTTGHEEFGAEYFAQAWSKAQALQCSREDFVSTLTALTARSIGQAIPISTQRVILSGGGAHNATLVAFLRSDLSERSPAPELSLSDEFGIPVDAKEAMVFALLGFQTLRGAINSSPSCTGARHPAILGKIVPGENYAELMQNTWR